MITKKKVKLFIPSPPSRVQEIIEEQKKAIAQKEKELREALPLLQKKFAEKKQDVNIEVFLGAQGQRTAYEILHAESKKDKKLLVYGISSKEKYPQAVIDLLKYFIYKDRKEKGLFTRKLAAEEARKEMLYRQDDSELKFLPYPTMMGFEVLGDVTMLLYEKEPIITMLIHSREIAQDYRKHFEFMWKHAKD